MKEKGKNLKDQINEKEIGKLPEKDFRVMIVKMIQDLRNRTENMQELINTFNKDLEETEDKNNNNNKQMNIIITEIKNNLEGIELRMTEAENQINNLQNDRNKQ